MSGFELQAYRTGHRDDYLRLLSSAWGPRALTGEEFDWWFDGNPSGSLRSVAILDGEVVGVAGHSLVPLQVGDERMLGQFSVHAVTDPRARGLGIFRALEARHEREGADQGSSCVLAFASAPTRPLFLGPLGWSQIDRRRIWARPLRALAGRLARRPVEARRKLPVATRDGVQPLAEFGEAEERAWHASRRSWGNHVARTAAYLRWRYGDSPRGYTAIRSDNGFAVLGVTMKGGSPIGLLMDIFGPADEARRLLRRCLADAAGLHAVIALPSPSVPRTVLARHGFVPTHARVDFMGKALSRPLDVSPLSWSVSFGDTDFC